VFLLHKVLPIGAVFPFDFGFVPGTRAEDGDPLDIMLLGEEATFTGPGHGQAAGTDRGAAKRERFDDPK